MAHPDTMWNGEEEVLPVRRLWVTEGAVDNAESGLQVRALVTLEFESQNFTPTQDGFERDFLSPVAKALTLDTSGAEVILVPKCRFQYGPPGWTIETFQLVAELS